MITGVLSVKIQNSVNYPLEVDGNGPTRKKFLYDYSA
jgi:hypothetical protein